jgi:hypothetical protein
MIDEAAGFWLLTRSSVQTTSGAYYDRTDSPLWKITEAAADVVDPR